MQKNEGTEGNAGMQYNQTESNRELFIRLNRLRGILAVCVLLSHVWGYTGLVFLIPFNKAVTISVALFFFLSGYGMTLSAEKKGNYRKEILLIKIPWLLYMAILAYLFSALAQMLLKVPATEEGSYLPFGIKQFFVSTNWYVYELIGFYLVFAITLKIKSGKIRTGIVSFISAIALVLLYKAGVVEAYYNSIIGFSTGMIMGSLKKTEVLKKKVMLLCGVFIFAAGFGFMFILDKHSVLVAIIRNITAAGGMIIVTYICSIIDYHLLPNDYLCRISPELYFYHIPMTMLLHYVISNPYLYMIIVCITSFMLAGIMHLINQKVHQRWRTLISI